VELKAACLALKAFANHLSGSKVVWCSDNQNVASILLNGSRKADPHCSPSKPFTFVYSSVYPWILSGSLGTLTLELADLISRLTDFDDYELNDAISQGLDERWGPHSVDRFACNYNAKLPRFNSRFFQPSSEAVDAFCQDWRFNNNWLCPPVCLIARVNKHLELCHARGTLIVPLWKSSFFWNSCSKDGVHWSSFVIAIDWVYLPKFHDLFIKRKARNSLFGSRSLNFDVVALRIDFSRPRPPRPLEGIALCPLANVARVHRRALTCCNYRFPRVSHLLVLHNVFSFISLFDLTRLGSLCWFSVLPVLHFYLLIKVVWYPKMDQKVCLNMVKKDQLCGIALEKRN